MDSSVKEWDHNGKVVTDAQYTDGSPVSGLVTNKQGMFHYQSGALNGAAELYSPNGMPPLIVSQGSYAQGKRVGQWEDWGTNANKIVDAMSSLMNAAFQVDFFDFLADDQGHVTSHWSNGSIEGEVDGFDKNGNRVFTINVWNGALNGPFTFRITAHGLGYGGSGNESLDAASQPKTIVFQSNKPEGCIGGKLNARLASNPGSMMNEVVDQWLVECAAGNAAGSQGTSAQ